MRIGQALGIGVIALWALAAACASFGTAARPWNANVAGRCFSLAFDSTAQGGDTTSRQATSFWPAALSFGDADTASVRWLPARSRDDAELWRATGGRVWRVMRRGDTTTVLSSPYFAVGWRVLLIADGREDHWRGETWSGDDYAVTTAHRIEVASLPCKDFNARYDELVEGHRGATLRTGAQL